MTAVSDVLGSTFPFSAVVGNDDLKRALLMNLVDPAIGGVLIRGDRGTAKSTIVRALAGLLPSIRTRADCPVQCDPDLGPCAVCGDRGGITERSPRVVDLPLGATEDRVAGSIDLSHALSSGQRRFEAGLLGAAHRGVLYVDEVNLLPDHLVDLLLDVAASGRNVVERDGASASHPARFVLVGTMNPEEGELRPQLLDRFGLVVDVHTPQDVETRAEVVRRRIAYDADSSAFLARFAREESALRDAVLMARRAAPDVRVPEAMLRLIVDLCIEAQADGLRADITLHRAARAVAAIERRYEVIAADVYAAALLVLPHRQRAPRLGTPSPPDIAALIESQRDASDDAAPPDEDGGAPVPPAPAPDAPAGDQLGPEGERDGGSASHSTATDARIDVPLPTAQRGKRTAGRAVGVAPASRGRRVGVARWDRHSHDIAIIPTLIDALHRPTGSHMSLASLRMHRRNAAPSRLVLLVVDSSGSMGAHERMSRTKAGLRSMLERIYVRRDRVAVQAFRGARTELLLSPCRSIAAARAVTGSLPTGGGTPLRAALYAAAEVLHREHLRRPTESTLLVLVTDGRTRESVHDAATEIARLTTTSMVLDTETGASRLGRARQIANWLGASYELLP